MENIKKEIEQLKLVGDISRVFLFGSMRYSKKPEDIDILLYGNFNSFDGYELKAKLSLPIKRIQINCYKNASNASNRKLSYDIVLVDNQKMLNYFLKRNKNEMIEL